MSRIVLVKHVKCKYDLSDLKKVARAVADSFQKEIKGEIEINIVGNGKMRELSKLYRGQNKTTDVLAFAWQEDSLIKSDCLGQIYLCYPRIKQQAKIYKIIVEEEFCRVLIHGLLHLIGFDHIKQKEAKKMFAWQEKILNSLCNCQNRV